LRQQHEALRVATPKTIPVSPQRRRRAARSRLAERSNSVAARVLQDLQLSRAGRDVAKAIPRGGMAPNVQAVTMLLQQAINDSIGIGPGQRGNLSAEQTRLALERLDGLGDQVRDRIKQAMKGKS
jgi:hypothetical protein